MLMRESEDERERALVPILFLIYVCFPFLTTTFHCCCSPCSFFSVSIISYCFIHPVPYILSCLYHFPPLCDEQDDTNVIYQYVLWNICIVCINFFSVYCFCTLCVSSHSYNSFHDLCVIYLIFVVEMDGENIYLFNIIVLSCSYHVS